MKTFKLYLIISLIIPVIACNAQTKKQENKTASTDKIEAYYFHFTARCITCKTVEAEAKADIESLYGKKVNFQSINLDEESSKAVAEKLQIEGQSLIIVKGATKINITNEGFMFARSNPEKFKAIIKEKIDKLL